MTQTWKPNAVTCYPSPCKPCHCHPTNYTFVHKYKKIENPFLYTLVPIMALISSLYFSICPSALVMSLPLTLFAETRRNYPLTWNLQHDCLHPFPLSSMRPGPKSCRGNQCRPPCENDPVVRCCSLHQCLGWHSKFGTLFATCPSHTQCPYCRSAYSHCSLQSIAHTASRRVLISVNQIVVGVRQQQGWHSNSTH